MHEFFLFFSILVTFKKMKIWHCKKCHNFCSKKNCFFEDIFKGNLFFCFLFVEGKGQRSIPLAAQKKSLVSLIQESFGGFILFFELKKTHFVLFLTLWSFLCGPWTCTQGHFFFALQPPYFHLSSLFSS